MDNTERQPVRQVQSEQSRGELHAWGPFVPGLDEPERRARLRCLRTLVRLYCGPKGQDACTALLAAEHKPDLMRHAWETVDQLPARNLRAALATYAAVHSPEVRR